MRQLRKRTPSEYRETGDEEESGQGPRPGVPARQLALGPVLVFLAEADVLLAAAAVLLSEADAFGGAAFGGSERMPPQGSLETLASGIFFRVAL